MTTICELCNSDGGEIIFRHANYRVVRVLGEEGLAYRGFCRVIWNHHVKEMSDLEPSERSALMLAVFRVEAALRSIFNPEKMNIASLGNMTPHVHWHVIPRFKDDPAFPKPIWSVPNLPAEKMMPSKTKSPTTDWVDVLKRVLNKD